MKKILALILALCLAPISVQAQTAQTSGTITGNSCVVLSLSPGQSNASVQLTGTFTSGTINFTISNDGTNYFVSPTDSITSATAVGLSFVTVASAKFLQACGATVVGSVAVSLVATPAVAPKGGGGASSAVNITAVGGNAVTTTIPVSGTVTTTPSGTQVVTGSGTAGASATGVVSVQGIASGVNLNVGQATATNLNANVSQATAASLNATVVQATAANLNATVTATNLSTNTAQFGGVAATGVVGYAGQQLYPANTSGGGCGGVNTLTGTQIIKLNLSVASGATTTQAVGLVASKFIHVCAFEYDSVITTGGVAVLSYGTGTNCGAGNTIIWQISSAVGNYTITKGDGNFGIFEIPSGNALCTQDSSLGSTSRMQFTYAQY